MGDISCILWQTGKEAQRMGCILCHHGQNGIIGRADHIRHLGPQDRVTIGAIARGD